MSPLVGLARVGFFVGIFCVAVDAIGTSLRDFL